MISTVARRRRNPRHGLWAREGWRLGCNRGKRLVRVKKKRVREVIVTFALIIFIYQHSMLNELSEQ